MPLTIGVPREIFPGEKRVATVPDVVEKLIKLGFKVAIESGAGEAANFNDETYRTAGADIVADAAQLWAGADIVFKVRGPTAEEVALMREGSTLISFIWPAQNPELMQQLAARKATVLAIDSLPRQLSRAQKMDALTSMAGISGYRAVIEAANILLEHTFFTGFSIFSPKYFYIDSVPVHRRGGCRRPGGDRHSGQPGRHRARQRYARRSRRPSQVAGG